MHDLFTLPFIELAGFLTPWNCCVILLPHHVRNVWQVHVQQLGGILASSSERIEESGLGFAFYVQREKEIQWSSEEFFS